MATDEALATMIYLNNGAHVGEPSVSLNGTIVRLDAFAPGLQDREGVALNGPGQRSEMYVRRCFWSECVTDLFNKRFCYSKLSCNINTLMLRKRNPPLGTIPILSAEIVGPKGADQPCAGPVRRK